MFGPHGSSRSWAFATGSTTRSGPVATLAGGPWHAPAAASSAGRPNLANFIDRAGESAAAARDRVGRHADDRVDVGVARKHGDRLVDAEEDRTDRGRPAQRGQDLVG